MKNKNEKKLSLINVCGHSIFVSKKNTEMKKSTVGSIFSGFLMLLLLTLFIPGKTMAQEFEKNKFDQYEISGKIVDIKTGNGINGALVLIKHTTIGNISNQEGNFILKIPDYLIGSELEFSILGYTTKTVLIKSLKQGGSLISLNPVSFKLKGATVESHSREARRILTKALRKVSKNYSKKACLTDAFFRETVMQDGDYIELSEGILNVYKAPYTKDYIKDQVKLIKGRTNNNPLNYNKIQLNLKGGPHNIVSNDILKNKPGFLDFDYIDYYFFDIEDTIQFKDRQTVVIKFKAKDDIQMPEAEFQADSRTGASTVYKKKDDYIKGIKEKFFPIYKGRIYIDQESFAIVYSTVEVSEKGLEFMNKYWEKNLPENFTSGLTGVLLKNEYRKHEEKWVLSTTEMNYHIKVKNEVTNFQTLFQSNALLINNEVLETNAKQFKSSELSKASDIFAKQTADFKLDFWEEENYVLPDGELEEAFDRINDQHELMIQLGSMVKKAWKNNKKESLYLQTDKQVFLPGEKILFKAYLRDLQTEKIRGYGEVIHVLLVNDKFEIKAQGKYLVDNCVAAGFLEMPEDLVDGNYNLVAYSDWMVNYNFEEAYITPVTIAKSLFDSKGVNFTIKSPKVLPGKDIQVSLGLNHLSELKNKKSIQYRLYNGKELVSEEKLKLMKGKAEWSFKMPGIFSDNGLFIEFIDAKSKQVISHKIRIPVDQSSLVLNFYPEGGNLVEGLNTKIAFEALDNYGTPIDIKGEIIDDNENKVVEFQTMHEGMGEFILNPQYDYMVRITEPQIYVGIYNFPETQENGLVLNLISQTKNHLLFKVNKSTKESETLFISLKRGNKFHSLTEFELSDYKTITLPCSDLPAGICEVTVFNSNHVPLAERLIYINRHKKINIRAELKKEQISTEEKQTLKIFTSDENGEPCEAELCLSVSDSLSNYKDHNIATYFYFKDYIKGRVSDPSFYLQDTKEAKKALDLLLMTRGFRKYSWQQIQSMSEKSNNWKNKSGVKGLVSYNNGDPVVNGKVLLLNTSLLKSIETNTNEFGEFYFPIKEYATISGDNLVVSATDSTGSKNVKIVVSDEVTNRFNETVLNQAKNEEMDLPGNHMAKKVEGAQISLPIKKLQTYTGNIVDGFLLGEATITASKKRKKESVIESMRKEMYLSSLSVKEMKGKDIFISGVHPGGSGFTFKSYYDMVRTIHPCQIYTKQVQGGVVAAKIIFRGRSSKYTVAGALFVIDGIPYGEELMDLPVMDFSSIESVKVYPSSLAPIAYGGRHCGGVVEIYLKNEIDRKVEADPNLFILNSYQIQKEYYVEQYKADDSVLPEDFNSTVYWNPIVKTDRKGKAKIEFTHNKRNSKYLINIEGFNEDGKLGVTKLYYQVNPQQKNN